MIRFIAAGMLLIAATMPAFACEWNKTVSTDTRSSTIASQPANDQAPPPPSSQAPS